jgi:NOL1/NOP2/fmu family ribosome biogenesis protein
VSNEVIKTRLGVLFENMTKWGGENVVITCNDPKDFSRLENYFDVIVIDAPCSGSGLFRRDQEAIKEWSEENVMLCAHRQQRILADALPALKKEGVLIYSTCSYSKQEDEDLLDWVTKTFDLATVRLDLDENWSIVETISDKYGSYGYRFYPDKLKGEGFFIAALRKRGGEDFYQPKNKRSTLERLTKKDESLTKSWIRQDARAVQIKFENLVYAIPEPLWNDFIFLKSSVYIKKAGVLLGKLAPNDLIPDHELALSKLFNEDVHSIELSIDQALDYLRKEDLKVDLDRKGWFLVKYENQNLGWLKALPNRINNYYPADWRIKKR